MASSGAHMCWAIICAFLIGISLGESDTLFGDATFWRNEGLKELKLSESKPIYNGKAKNVIVFVGDGMDISMQTLGSYLKTNGEKHKKQSTLTFQKFPNVGLSRTYSASHYTPDSASTATAIFTGVKCRSGVVGYDATVGRMNCWSARGKTKLKSVFREAQEGGRSVGIITTDIVVGATPSATYANNPSRYWIHGRKRGGRGFFCQGIADQLIENTKDFNVVFGGGRSFFNSHKYNLWSKYQQSKNRNFQYITKKTQLLNLDTTKVDNVFGLFTDGPMTPQLLLDESKRRRDQEPSLVEMVQTAHSILSRNKNGYFLMVEGSNVDKSNHRNWARMSVNDVLGLDRAVEYIKNNTNPEETLIVVTSDHGHTTTFGNYMPRGQDIFDLVKDENNNYVKAKDGYPFTAIGYGTGSAFRADRRGQTSSAVRSSSYPYQAVVQRKGGSHSGVPVPIYAHGVKAHLISTLHEQPFIYYVMKRAACMGKYSSREGC